MRAVSLLVSPLVSSRLLALLVVALAVLVGAVLLLASGDGSPVLMAGNPPPDPMAGPGPFRW